MPHDSAAQQVPLLEELATRVEAPSPGPIAPPDPTAPTRAFREASTPGPQAADRATNADPTSHLGEPPVAPSRFPPVPGYTLDEFVGKGGMGFVYRGRHHATGRTVALKLITPRGASDETARARFAREVHALAAIKHPNIVPVYDAGEWHGFPYCTMEYVVGGNLSTHLDRIRADRAGAVALVAKVARAVHRLHAENIIHRDIKPLNILLDEHDEPLVADFGLAKWMDEESDLTISHVPVGTRAYMAPEQTLGRKRGYTTACDVWALGVTLYEVLTGRRPFPDDGSSDLDPVPMTDLVPDLPEALQAVVLKCLAKRPEDRYPTAAALADDLDRWLNREPVLAPAPVPVPTAEPTAEPPATPARRRRRTRAVLVALGLALAVLGTAALVPKRSIEKRIAAGKPVRLTDDKGRPIVEPVDEPEHLLLRDTWDEYQSFSRHGTGITNFIDVPLPEEYRVEAELAVGFNTQHGDTRAGIYAGRRPWPGMPYRFETMATVSIAPRLNGATNLREIRGMHGLYSWGRGDFGYATIFSESSTLWGGENTDTAPRFAQVRLEVRKHATRATIDGVDVKPMPTVMITKLLNCDIDDRQKFQHFPVYRIEESPLGNGIGIFCVNNTCVVRNLTVTRLEQ